MSKASLADCYMPSGRKSKIFSEYLHVFAMYLS